MVLNSGFCFCVLKAIYDLQKVGVYSCALIKKRKYWQKGIPGEVMQLFFDVDGVDVGDCHAIQGVMEWTTYNLWGMKEPDYVMQMMATGGLLDANKSCRMASPRWNDGGVNIHARLIGNFGIGMQWTITTTCSMDCLSSRTVGESNGGRLVCSRSSSPSPR
jgi:hypothetical protein